MRIIVLLAILLSGIRLMAQDTSASKPLSLGLHFFYNDFVTPPRIQNSDVFDVIGSGNWAKVSEMQTGFGLDVFKGLRSHLDFVGSVNAVWVDYLKPSGASYGNVNLMLDLNSGFHWKALNDKHALNPFLITKLGYAFYKDLSGFMAYPGLGIQGNFFDQFFINAALEYKLALSSSLSNQLYYSLGVATNIRPPKVLKRSPIIEDAKPVSNAVKKDIVVIVTDEATGQLLPYVKVTLESEGLEPQTQYSSDDGRVLFVANPPRDYFITGRLNNIDATTAKFAPNDFANEQSQLVARLTHNDPRFTLIGNTNNLRTGMPVGNTKVTIQNTTQASVAFCTSAEGNGQFRTQLEAASDFVIFGKKENYMSNIERISTKGLNRSTTLFVKLQLGVEEVVPGKNIVLNKIYFETGKVNLDTKASADLERLVQFLKDNPTMRLEIQGHTDNIGSAKLNRKISLQRAVSVVNYLAKQGIPKEHLVAKGFGADSPIADNATLEGRTQNRRVEMRAL
ncbi:MAG: OmpA family protein [Bacteroidetes bacterium]|nr:OmpA family protein [Bacteroidota bacterium]